MMCVLLLISVLHVVPHTARDQGQNDNLKHGSWSEVTAHYGHDHGSDHSGDNGSGQLQDIDVPVHAHDVPALNKHDYNTQFRVPLSWDLPRLKGVRAVPAFDIERPSRPQLPS
jgi:hypothetical protein